MKLPLSKGYYALISRRDYPLVRKYKWHADVRKLQVYASTSMNINGKRCEVRMHVLLLGTLGKGHSVIGEHKNGDGLDNRRRNLRLANKKQNAWNARPQKGRLFRGITLQKRLKSRPWQARIHREGETKHLGYFATAIQAAIAYNREAKRRDGKFVRLNAVRVI